MQTIMKTRLILSALAALAVFTSCDGIFDDDPFIEDDDTVAILDGNTLTYGSHHYTFDETSTKGTVTFTHFPATVREFSAVQDELLGNSKPGALVLEIMAFEMYRRDRTKGQKCIEKCNLAPNAKTVIANLSQRFPDKRDNLTDDSRQPYLVSAFLKGSTQENGYQPDYPYEITFTESTAEYAKQGEYSISGFGRVYTWETVRGGWRDVSATVLVSDDEYDFVLVNDCAALYSEVPAISDWKDTLK